MPNTKILALGHYMPPNIVTNEYLASTLELLEEEIVKRTGIEERRYVDSGTSCSELALHAVENAVHRSGLFQEIDLIIFATLSPDHFFPGSGCFLQASETSKRTGARHPQRGFLGSAALGMAFAAGWTPCIGPILGGIIGLAATSGGWRSGLVLSAFYSAGLAVPFLLTGLGINQFLSFYKNFRRHLHKVEVVSGVVLILVGLLVMSGKSTTLATSKFMALIPNAEGLLNRWFKSPEQNPAAPTTTAQNFEMAPDVEFQTLAGKPFRL